MIPGKAILGAALINSALFLLPLAFVEGAFRLLPVSHPPYVLPVNADNPVTRFQPNVDFQYSGHWNFEVKASRHTNNYGFSHVADYHPGETTPLLMVIGDSFVEGHAVDAGKSIGELLHAAVQGDGRAYSIGFSGAPLSQYLVYADYARATFRPQAMAFVIIGNDFDESLLKYKSDGRFHYFEEKADGLALRRIDYEMSSTRKILRQSAFLRYVMLNLQAGERLSRLLAAVRGSDHSAPPDAGQRLLDSQRAVDLFLDALPSRSGLDPQSIVFVLDAVRPAIYSPEELAKADDSYHSRMRRYLARQAGARGYDVIDLQPVFIARHERDGTKFEAAPSDGHWSALGHKVAAEALEKSAVYRRLFPARKGAPLSAVPGHP